MFTIRVVEGNRQSHAMYSGSSYSVTKDAEAALLTIHNDGQTPRKLVLQDGAVAYVMNTEGNTVDTIRTPSPVAALRTVAGGG